MKYVFKILIVILIFSCKTKNTGVKNVIVNNPPKNLLFIITDQQRYDALSYAGNTVADLL